MMMHDSARQGNMLKSKKKNCERVKEREEGKKLKLKFDLIDRKILLEI